MIRPDPRSPIPRYWIRTRDLDWIRRGTTGRRLRPRRTLGQAPAGKARHNAKLFLRQGMLRKVQAPRLTGRRAVRRNADPAGQLASSRRTGWLTGLAPAR